MFHSKTSVFTEESNSNNNKKQRQWHFFELWFHFFSRGWRIRHTLHVIKPDSYEIILVTRYIIVGFYVYFTPLNLSSPRTLILNSIYTIQIQLKDLHKLSEFCFVCFGIGIYIYGFDALDGFQRVYIGYMHGKIQCVYIWVKCLIVIMVSIKSDNID